MNLCNYLRLYSLLCALLITIPILGEGFIAGTLVCTPQGHVPIEELSVGDEVITSDLNFYRVEPIVHVTRYVVKEYVRIKIKDVVIEVAADHPFLLPCEQRWKQACKLTVRACLVGAPINAEFIDSVETIHQKTSVYTLSLKQCHTYLVSERNIIVHNNDAGSLALELVKGSGLITSLAAVSAFVPPAAIIAGGGTVIGLVVWSFVDGIRSVRKSSRDGSSHTVTDSNAPSQNSSHRDTHSSETDIDRSPPVRGLGQFDGFESEADRLQKDIVADTRRRHIEASLHAATLLVESNEPTRTCGTGEIKETPLPHVENLPVDTTKAPVSFCPGQEHKTEPGSGCNSGVEAPKIEPRPCGKQGQALPGLGSDEVPVSENLPEVKKEETQNDEDTGKQEDVAGDKEASDCTGQNEVPITVNGGQGESKYLPTTKIETKQECDVVIVDELADLSDVLVKVEGRGNSRGRTEPNNHVEKLAMNEVMSNPKGILLKYVIMTDERWPAEEGWQKYAQNVSDKNGNSIEIHYVYSKKLNAYDDFKFKDKDDKK